MTDKNKFITFLKKNGLKPTLQRNLLVKQLLNGKNRHFTAEDLYDEMKLKKINISLATIYNTLHSFVEKKILKLVSIKEGKTIFCTNMKNHYHFFNQKTGKLIDISSEKIKINKLPKPPKGTRIDNIEITINLATKN
tara:strand:- start:538 stop:948 length:411 start_codon:yes stop_codon:yes gene_type:complete